MASTDEMPVPGIEVHRLSSEHVGDEFAVFTSLVGTPGPTPPPVLYMPDAIYNFGLAVDTLRLLVGAGDIEAVLIVAIGYPVEGDSERLRRRDLTPTADPAYTHRYSSLHGGAEKFIAFLQGELKPWVRLRFDVDTDDSALFGYSLGGLFCTYVLLNHTEMFTRYGVGGPALHWDNGLMFEHERAYAGSHDDLAARVHFSVGSLDSSAGDRLWMTHLPLDKRAEAEESAAAELEWDSVRDTTRMVEALSSRRYPSLHLEFDVLPDEYHHTAPPTSLSKALRSMFDAPREVRTTY
jgi:predicted alpha/beta superfamily hydrolase